MRYKRQLLKKPTEADPLQVMFGHYGQLSIEQDPGWLYPKAKSLHTAGHLALNQMQDTIERVLSVDWSPYRIEVARERQAESVKKARLALLGFLDKEIKAANEQVSKIQNEILRETAPIEATGNQAIIQEMRDSERRAYIRDKVEPKNRREFIASDVQWIRAAINSPDPLIDPAALHDIRRQWAFSQDPSLAELEKDSIAEAAYIRKRSAEINATAAALLIKSKIPDPISSEELYQVFTPRSDYEAALMAKKIQHEQSKADQEERRAEWEKKNKGIDLSAPSGMDEARQEQQRRDKAASK